MLFRSWSEERWDREVGGGDPARFMYVSSGGLDDDADAECECECGTRKYRTSSVAKTTALGERRGDVGPRSTVFK